MPFIKGRYHINATMGEALEAAREAEAALLARQHDAQSAAANDDGDDSDANPQPARDETAPIHRVEIEAAELVPSHSGRAQRGYVARVHRASAAANNSSVGAQSANTSGRTPGDSAWQNSRYSPPAPETHVFADHRDLINFLRDELAKDSSK